MNNLKRFRSTFPQHLLNKLNELVTTCHLYNKEVKEYADSLETTDEKKAASLFHLNLMQGFMTSFYEGNISLNMPDDSFIFKDPNDTSRCIKTFVDENGDVTYTDEGKQF